MEAQENDLPPSIPFRIGGFPTLKFKRAGTREFLDYDGDRSLESLIVFVEESAKNSLEPEAVTTSQDADSEQTPIEIRDEL
jgi:protein disulfide-isomerase A1